MTIEASVTDEIRLSEIDETNISVHDRIGKKIGLARRISHGKSNGKCWVNYLVVDLRFEEKGGVVVHDYDEIKSHFQSLPA